MVPRGWGRGGVGRGDAAVAAAAGAGDGGCLTPLITTARMHELAALFFSFFCREGESFLRWAEGAAVGDAVLALRGLVGWCEHNTDRKFVVFLGEGGEGPKLLLPEF